MSMNDDKFALYMIVGSLIVGLLVIGVLTTFAADTSDSGTYSICRPGGYDVICFSKKSLLSNGSMSCVPLSQVGGRCL